MGRNRTVLITGATGGIGKQTAIALAGKGYRVILNGRSEAAGRAALAEVSERSGNPEIGLLLADLSTQAGIQSLARQAIETLAGPEPGGPLDVLINNAGIAPAQRRLTEDGLELGFAVNVVAPYLLTSLLIESLRAAGAGRVVTLTGGSHPARIDLANLEGERDFVGLTAYSHAKLAMMAVMYEVALREGSGVTVNVCYPGRASTAMTQAVSADMFPRIARPLTPLFRLLTRPDDGSSAARAARSSVFLASAPELAGVTGRYFDTRSRMVDWPQPVQDPATREAVWQRVRAVTDGAGPWG